MAPALACPAEIPPGHGGVSSVWQASVAGVGQNVSTSGIQGAGDDRSFAHTSLTRARLLLAVQGRWNRPVTAVIAGAGFGKTTLLDQAVAENRLAHIGVDVALRLQAADNRALRLASRVLSELGVEAPQRDDVDELLQVLVDAVVTRAPMPICLVLDDVHELQTESAGFALFRRLVQALPGNAHVLLGSRTLPDIGIARLAVGGSALVLREDDMRFTDSEIDEFARLRGVEPEFVGAAQGWPALAELLARAPGITTGEYVWEQIISPLTDAAKARLVELAALGGADDDLASMVAGQPVVLAEVLVDIPLVSRLGDDWWQLHDVLADPICARQDPANLGHIRRRGGIHVRDRGEVDRSVRLLVAAQAWDEVLATIRGAFVQLGAPEDSAVAAVWAPLMPHALEDEPEVLLLRTIATTVANLERSFELGERTVAAFAARDDVDGEIAAIARLGAIAYGLMDSRRLAGHIARISELAATGHPWAVSFDAVSRGGFSLMTGDWRRAEATLAPVAADPANDVSQGLAAYLCARAQIEGGRFHEAARTLDRMPEHHRQRVRDGVLGVEVAIAQALGSAPAVIDRLRAVAESRADQGPVVARRVTRCRLAAGRATLGDLEGARAQLLQLELIGPSNAVTIDEELMATAAVAVLAGSEDEAAALLAKVPDRGVYFPPLEGSTLLYVLRPELRDRYHALDLEGVHAQRREFATAFVAARAGDLEPLGRFVWPRASVVQWFALAPWIVEAAIYSRAAGGTPPHDLLDPAGPIQRQVLRRLASSPIPAVARTSVAIAAALPPVAPDLVEVRILGLLEIDVGGHRSTAPELRRERVRSLLGLLVLRRSVSRAEAAGILWPELGDDQASANLRVTLTHLLRLIEPRRDKNAPSFFIRHENGRLTVFDDGSLRVDSWEFEAAATEAEDFERRGAPSLALDALVRAVGMWRGDLLADVESHEWADFDRLRLSTLFVRSALRAGELLAAHHELGHAALMAERAIAADQWGEAPYRLLASVHLERKDRSAARRVLDHLDDVLAELGVGPGPETLSLRRRVLEGG